MELIEAKILLRNLLKRIKPQEDGTSLLPGVLTDDELEALNLALVSLDGSGDQTRTTVVPVKSIQTTLEKPPRTSIPSFPEPLIEQPEVEIRVVDYEEPAEEPFEIELDLSALYAPPPPDNVRLCLDFGTAMSKATLAKDEDDEAPEEIHVLRLGIPGDQEEISEVMLISSVFIDAEGKLWFGKEAVDRSMVEGGDGSRQRMDNIKRRLSEDGWDEVVSKRLNPTGLDVTYGQMVLAYLMYLTWAVNHCLEEMGYPWTLARRFAMPCISGQKGRETVSRLSRAVGDAQILADTFYASLKSGVPLKQFIAALRELRSVPRKYGFVDEDITEPLGVAGSIMSWKKNVDMLMLVVDVGAGTTDLSLYRIHFDPSTQNDTAIEIENSSRYIDQAGNHLDRWLIELIIKKSGLTSDDPMWINERSALELRVRDYKESLFNDQYVYVTLMNGTEVDIELGEFLKLSPVEGFRVSLRETVTGILESVDLSWIDWILANPSRNLVIALTGGGAELPMVKELAEGFIKVHGRSVPVARALQFPNWLRDIDENLEGDYPRVAVSLGGARRRLMQRGNVGRVTAGDGTLAPTLSGYYTKGI